MNRKFIYTEPFRKSWKLMGLSDADLIPLEEALRENPSRGAVIEGTGGARKMRIVLHGRGKSGGGRVIYLDVYERGSLYLLYAYDKTVREDLTEAQKKILRSVIETIKKG